MKKFSSSFFDQITPEWTLFLDRDGVINLRLIDDYVKNVDEFEFLLDVKAVLEKIKPYFGRVVVVTNQQGIGKGLMSEQDLAKIHEKMLNYLHQDTFIIDKIYFCGDLKNTNSQRRKPEIGMAEDAKRDFAEIDFSKSLIIGDSLSDMQFGRKAGMKTVFFGEKKEISEVDFWVETWLDFL